MNVSMMKIEASDGGPDKAGPSMLEVFYLSASSRPELHSEDDNYNIETSTMGCLLSRPPSPWAYETRWAIYEQKSNNFIRAKTTWFSGKRWRKIPARDLSPQPPTRMKLVPYANDHHSLKKIIRRSVTKNPRSHINYPKI